MLASTQTQPPGGLWRIASAHVLDCNYEFITGNKPLIHQHVDCTQIDFIYAALCKQSRMATAGAAVVMAVVVVSNS